MDKNFLKQLTIGNRRVLAQAITLVESTLPKDIGMADQLLLALPSDRQALCLGITGAPGVGKSSFIESFGMFLVGLGKKVAVLAIDPSSPLAGGAILGDKTRMEGLSRHPNAYIRPSASGGYGGGLTSTTGDVIAVLEAAGFEIIIIETIGVGQNETAVKDYVDQLVYLISPASGDELQALKKGIGEVADIIVVTKDDQELRQAAEKIALTYKLIDKNRPVFKSSAREERGMTEIWQELEKRLSVQANPRHEIQRLRRFQDKLRQEVVSSFLSLPDVANQYSKIMNQVRQGKLLTMDAVQKLIKLGFKS